uniref:RAB6A-GEF complex partner protein 2 n=1 Tax=Syphacia muris TaxID=451379 RepID=A0A0N5AMS4_9BILA
MPIEVTAVLDRDPAVYLAGEAIHCKVIVKNNGSTEEEPLAWGSVHVQCERIISSAGAGHDELVKKTSQGERWQRKHSTAMSRSAFTVFSCRPAVLFCELRLQPGEQREFECIQQLPCDGIPPSFKGFLVRYMYKLTLGVQHLKSPIKLINIPLRVIQSDVSVLQPVVQSNTNPFIANEKIGPSIIDLMTEVTDCLTAPHGCFNYNMTNHRGKIANFILFKKAFKLGEDVIGRFVFTDCDVPCIQFTVSVQTIESLNDDPDSKKYVANYMTEHVVCAFWKDALVKLHIPLSATPSFHTETVQLKWRLHFELVMSSNLMNTMEEGITEAPENLDIETMTWDLDIKVFPCSPYNVALTTNGLSSTASLTM